MRFLADECCDFSVVKALRTAGHDVLCVAETRPRADDTDVIKLAARGRRILLTEDKDFGQLVYAHGHQIPGVVFLRFPTSMRTSIADDVVKLVDQQGENVIGCFITVQPGKIRITRPPR
jgi:predicted nuclease of predicted toxin-antitoxin system